MLQIPTLQPMEYLIILGIWAVIGGVVGMAIGDIGGKKNGATGGLLGALLGPIGWIVVAVLPPAETATPKAKTQTPADAATLRKIAEMEKQLADLKGGGKSILKPSAKPVDDDASIPTYKLD